MYESAGGAHTLAAKALADALAAGAEESSAEASQAAATCCGRYTAPGSPATTLRCTQRCAACRHVLPARMQSARAPTRCTAFTKE